MHYTERILCERHENGVGLRPRPNLTSRRGRRWPIPWDRSQEARWAKRGKGNDAHPARLRPAFGEGLYRSPANRVGRSSTVALPAPSPVRPTALGLRSLRDAGSGGSPTEPPSRRIMTLYCAVPQSRRHSSGGRLTAGRKNNIRTASERAFAFALCGRASSKLGDMQIN